VRIVYIGLAIFIAQIVVWVIKPKSKFFSPLFRGPFAVFDKVEAKHIFSILAIKWLSFAFDLICTWLGLIAFDIEVPAAMILAYLPIIYLIGALPITVFRMGSVPAWLFFFNGMAPDATLIAFSALWNFSMLFVRAMTGVVCLPRAMGDFKRGQEEFRQD